MRFISMRLSIAHTNIILLTFRLSPPFDKTKQTLAAYGRETANSLSGFGDVTIPLPKNFSLFGGMRYTYDRKATNNYVGTAYGPQIDFCGDNNSFLNNFHNILYRVGMGWEPTEQVNVYLKYSRGYNAGGVYYNGCNDPYKPEHLGTIEGGVKGRFFDGRLVFDADGYWNHFTDFQIYKNLRNVFVGSQCSGSRNVGRRVPSYRPSDRNIQANVSLSIIIRNTISSPTLIRSKTYNPRTGAPTLI